MIALDEDGVMLPANRPEPPVVLTVLGKPITQGSKTRTHYGLRDDNAKTLKPWRVAIATAGAEAMHGRERLLGPVLVGATFYFERPKSHYGTGKNAHRLKDSAPRFPMSQGKDGDLDKLLRAICDGVSDGGVWRDDVQVVGFGETWKRWAGEDGGLHIPGAVVRVTPL